MKEYSSDFEHRIYRKHVSVSVVALGVYEQLTVINEIACNEHPFS